MRNGPETPCSNRFLFTSSSSSLFENGKIELKSSSFAQLDVIIAAIKQSNKSCVIIGHTDNEGSKEFNQQLSLQRAFSVQKYFIKNGIPEKNIE